MVIEQGDVFWADLPPAIGSEPGFRHPVIVIQNNVFNRSKLSTAVVCLLTSNTALAAAPCNVPLAKGEANLRKRSVINVSQVYTLDKTQLVEKIGTVSNRRMDEIMDGLALVLARGK